MIYENEVLVDSSNPTYLTIKTTNIRSKEFIEIVKKCFNDNGFTPARGTGRYDSFSKKIIFSMKYDARTFIRFDLLENSSIIYEDSVYAKQLNVKAKGKKSEPVYNFDFDFIRQVVQEKMKKTVEFRQNKTISIFRKDMYAPWFIGNIQDVIPNFQTSNFSMAYRYRAQASYKEKNVKFSINGIKEFTKKEFANIDFDDIQYNLNATIGTTKLNVVLKMDGIKTALTNLEELKKFVDSEEAAVKIKTQPIVDEINLLQNQIRQLENKISIIQNESNERISNFSKL